MNNKYTLEGMFSTFERRNIGSRIYDMNDYNKHLFYLKRKVRIQKLVDMIEKI